MRALEALPICHCKARRTNHLSLQGTKHYSSVIASPRSNLSFWFVSLVQPRSPSYARPPTVIARHEALLICHCEPAKQSLFLVCQPRTTEIATLLCLVKAPLGVARVFVKAPYGCCETRSNLSFLFAIPDQPRSPRSSVLSKHPMGVARHEAISLFCLPALNNRDRHAPLAMTKILSLRGTKQSLFSVCLPRATEIATLRSR